MAPMTFFTPASNGIVGYTFQELVEKHTPANPKQIPPEIRLIEGQHHVLQFHFNTTDTTSDFILDAVFSNKKPDEGTVSLHDQLSGNNIQLQYSTYPIIKSNDSKQI